MSLISCISRFSRARDPPAMPSGGSGLRPSEYLARSSSAATRARSDSTVSSFSSVSAETSFSKPPVSLFSASIAPDAASATAVALSSRSGRPHTVMPSVSSTKCKRSESKRYQKATSASKADASLCASLLCPLRDSCPKSRPHFKIASSSDDSTSPSTRRIRCPCIATEEHQPRLVASIGRSATFFVPALACSVALRRIMCCREYTSHTASPR
mmetsp:Transcript_4235/g.17985  ORF Transcript_4235/g.17985 Transcript_4235/m.17985 type:complete len:213 (+) Transcript_4235:206-844(+)